MESFPPPIQLGKIFKEELKQHDGFSSVTNNTNTTFSESPTQQIRNLRQAIHNSTVSTAATGHSSNHELSLHYHIIVFTVPTHQMQDAAIAATTSHAIFTITKNGTNFTACTIENKKWKGLTYMAMVLIMT